MTKRPSLFGNKASAAPATPVEPRALKLSRASEPVEAVREVAPGQKWAKASTREGKRVVSAYLDPEAFRQLKRIAVDEDTQQQELLIEAINLLFDKRGLSRIA